MINIPKTEKKRIVIAGCGFAGLILAKKLRSSGYQVVIIDKHNYHQFPPLYYQVASAGLEASSIVFPLRKIFQHYKDFYIRKAEVREINDPKNKPHKKFIYRDLGTMATIGKHLAVVKLPFIHFHGVFAWFVWMFIHLMSIIGVRNKLMIFINWAWKYFTYDQSLRLILRPKGCI